MEKDKEFKETKYSFRGPINLDTIPNDDIGIALVEFSKGSAGLALCLRVLWQYGLKTYASYPGNSNVFDIAYIVMEENEDIFSFLSKDFLNNNGIRINVIDNRQVVYFLGNKGEKSSEMIMLAQNILSGRKNNTKLIEERIGEAFPTGWIRRLKTYESNENCTYWSGKVYIK